MTASVRLADTLRFARDAATGYPLRTTLSVLAMSIGVAAVVILTALGTGLLFGVMPARRAACLDPAQALMKH